MSRHHSGQYYVSKAERAGCRTRPAGGDHMKIYAPDDGPYHGEHVAVPMHRELKTGTEHAVRSFFLKVGIALGVLAGLASLML